MGHMKLDLLFYSISHSQAEHHAVIVYTVTVVVVKTGTSIWYVCGCILLSIVLTTFL